MNKDNELIKIDDVKSLAEFLQQPTLKIAKFLTGILVSDSKDWKLSAGHLVQASIKSKLFTQLGKEIEGYINKGKLKEDYLNKPQNQQSLSDLLKFIDEESPDEDRFHAMKSLFMKSILIDSTDEEQFLSYHFMKLCKQLDSGDLLVIKAAFDIKNGKIAPKLSGVTIALNNKGAHAWLNIISKQIGHGIVSLVEVHEDKLVNLKLISPRTAADNSGISDTGYYRLTDLGYKMCQFIYTE